MNEGKSYELMQVQPQYTRTEFTRKGFLTTVYFQGNLCASLSRILSFKRLLLYTH